MLIKNQNLAGAALTLGGKSYQGDKRGIFRLPDDEAEKILKTPGWIKARVSRNALELLRKADALRAVARQAQADADAAAKAADEALLAVDRGTDTADAVDADYLDGEALDAAQGAPVAAPSAPVAAPSPPTPPSDPQPTPKAPETGSGEAPTMRWSLARLREYAEGAGIEIAVEWTKAEVLDAIEQAAG
jgi:hypothetical protein